MIAHHPTSVKSRSENQEPQPSRESDPPINLAHVLFVLWATASVAWAFFAAGIAYREGWWSERPEMAAALVLAPPVLVHFLANFLIGVTGNPRFR